MPRNRSFVRALAWAAIAAQPLFVLTWIVAGPLDPGYSHLHQSVSDLGGRFAEHPWIVNAGFVVLGLSIAALAPGLLATLPRGVAAGVTAALFVFVGASMAAMGFLPLDCSFTQESCERRFNAGDVSGEMQVHVWLGFALLVALLATPFGIWRALRRNPLGLIAFVSGGIGLVIGVGGFAFGFTDPDDGVGLANRIEYVFLHVWLLEVAIGILYATRRPPAPSELIPLLPRDFVARTWTGEGELVLRPFFLGRRIPVRFPASRKTTWISEQVWRMDDEARFAHGRALTRRTFVEFLSDEHARLTASDLPYGADVYVEESGYRIAPFAMTFPFGPLPLAFSCRDLSYVEPDGTFVNVTDVRTPVGNIPLARLYFRVRPESRSEETAGAADQQEPAISGAR